MSERAVLYARVSSDDRSKDGRNLASQLEDCTRHAQQHDYRIVAELHEDDKGACGASLELPQLGRIVEMAQGGLFDVLVVRELDRLSRNLAKQLIVEEVLNRYGVRVEYALAEYDDSPEGRLQKHVRATVAEYEREKIKERNARGRRNKVLAGKLILHGVGAPYGYTVSDDRTMLVICEQEAEIIRLMYHWYTVGDESGGLLSSFQIADRLNAMQVPTWVMLRGDQAKGLKEHRKRSGIKWLPPTVMDMIHNPTYMGKWYYGDGKTRNYNPNNPLVVDVPAIVSVATWEAAQQQARKNTITAKRNTKYNYLLQYRLTCMCGYGVRTCTRTGKPLLPYYNCLSVSTNLANGNCGLPYFRADHVDGLVWYWLGEWFKDPDKLEDRLNDFLAERDQRNAPILAMLNANENLILRKQGELDSLLDLYLAGSNEAMKPESRKARVEAYQAREAQLVETIEKLKQEKGKLVDQLDTTLSAEGITEVVTFARAMADGVLEAGDDFGKRRRIIELLDVRGKLAVENGEKVLYAWFILTDKAQPKRLSVSNWPKMAESLSIETLGIQISHSEV